MSAYHQPIMLEQVLLGLAVKPNNWYVDATLGGGGHTEAILQAGGLVVGLDQDEEALSEVKQRLGRAVDRQHLRLIKANFRDLQTVLEAQNITKVSGVLIDLGVSSHQLDTTGRGFSFDSDTLDMRMDTAQPVTAADLLARLSERDLARLLADLGEEHYAKRFARAIVAQRDDQPFTSGVQLAEFIKYHSPPAYRYGRLHPATRVFQALRLAVNDELGSLQSVLPETSQVLQAGGRLAVISFHSLEDRLVKHFMQQTDVWRILTSKPMRPADTELADNSRSRSAKLRLAERKE